MKPKSLFLLAALSLAIPARGIAATITNTVSDVNDDTYGLTSSGDNWTDDKVVCGYESPYVVPYLTGAFRFNGISLTNRTVISHAYLRVQAYLPGTGASSFSMKGEAYDSTDSYLGGYVGLRSLTAAGASWSVPSAWAEDGVYTSPDIATIVQEIVNRPGWASGNALAIQLQNAASSGGRQLIYSVEGAAKYGTSPAQLIIEYIGAAPLDGVKSENYISGATNATSLVPTYLNDGTMYYPYPAGADGICWATCTADILAYWDRNPYNGVKYWNLIDNGTAPLLQPSLPASPGHDQANVKAAISYLADQYYGLNNRDEKAMIESFCNTSNGLSFVATYHGPVSSTADRTTFLGIIRGEINAGRPIGIGSLGTYFGGGHQIPVIGYKEMSNTVNSTVYIHDNRGGTENQYVNFYASSWGLLDMDQIVPGGTPVDEYEAIGDNTSSSTVNLDPDNIYGFRQTHNFSFAGDVDWVWLSAVSNRRYSVTTTNLGVGADTLLTLYQSDGTTQIDQNDNGGGETRASKIVWNCWATGTVLIRVADAASGSGHAANYDLQVSYVSPASPGKATNPSPTHQSTGGATNASLSWTAGAGATGYRVNFGTSVTPPFVRNQVATTFSTNMASGTTYYWRIDPTNSAGVTTGDVWQFTTAAAVSLEINPASTNFTSAGWSGRTIAVTANLPWTAVSNAAWLAVTGGSPGANNGTVTFSVAANSGTSARTGGVVVAGGGISRTCTVVQARAAGNPQIQADESFGVVSNRFGFNINWASGRVVVVDGCTNLANPAWIPLQTNTLTGGLSYFSDSKWTNYIGRFYRIRSSP